MSTINYNNIECPILKSWEDSEWNDQHYEILYKDQIKTLYKSSEGIGETYTEYDGFTCYVCNYKYHRDNGPALFNDREKHWFKKGMKIKKPRNFYAVAAHFKSGAGPHSSKDQNTCYICGIEIDQKKIICDSEECAKEFENDSEDQ